MLFATDLDRTIIYSNKFVENYQTVSCVEHLDGREISYMSHRALELLAQVKTAPISIWFQLQLAL